MIIKLQRSKAHTDYLIFDNVENVNYHTQPVKKPEIGQSSVTHDRFWYSPETGDQLLNKISYRKDGEGFNLYFDGEAFICNDDGKTIQRVTRLPSNECTPGSIK